VPLVPRGDLACGVGVPPPGGGGGGGSGDGGGGGSGDGGGGGRDADGGGALWLVAFRSHLLGVWGGPQLSGVSHAVAAGGGDDSGWRGSGGGHHAAAAATAAVVASPSAALTCASPSPLRTTLVLRLYPPRDYTIVPRAGRAGPPAAATTVADALAAFRGASSSVNQLPRQQSSTFDQHQLQTSNLVLDGHDRARVTLDRIGLAVVDDTAQGSSDSWTYAAATASVTNDALVSDTASELNSAANPTVNAAASEATTLANSDRINSHMARQLAAERDVALAALATVRSALAAAEAALTEAHCDADTATQRAEAAERQAMLASVSAREATAEAAVAHASELAALSERCERQASELVCLRGCAAEAEALRVAAEAAAGDARTALSDAAARVAQLEATVAGYDEEIARLTGRLAGAQDALVAASAEAGERSRALVAALDDARATAATLAADLDAARARCDAATAEAERATAARARTISKAKEKLREAAERHAGELAAARREGAEQLAAASAAADTSGVRPKAAEAQQSELSRALEAAEAARRAGAVTAVSGDTARVSALVWQLADMRREVDDARRGRGEREAELYAARGASASALAALGAERDSLAQQLAALQSAVKAGRAGASVADMAASSAPKAAHAAQPLSPLDEQRDTDTRPRADPRVPAEDENTLRLHAQLDAESGRANALLSALCAPLASTSAAPAALCCLSGGGGIGNSSGGVSSSSTSSSDGGGGGFVNDSNVIVGVLSSSYSSDPPLPAAYSSVEASSVATVSEIAAVPALDIAAVTEAAVVASGPTLSDRTDADELPPVLEPQAAAIRVLKALGPDEAARLRNGSKLMVVMDSGHGGMIDITSFVVRRAPFLRHNLEDTQLPDAPLELDELQPPGGGPWGSVDVDEHFRSFLEEHLMGGRKITFPDWIVARESWLVSKERWDHRNFELVDVDINQLVHAENFDGDAYFSDAHLQQLNARFIAIPALASCRVERVGRARILHVHLDNATMRSFVAHSIAETAKEAKRMLAQPDASDTELVVVASCYAQSKSGTAERFFDRLRSKLTMPNRHVIRVHAVGAAGPEHSGRTVAEQLALMLEPPQGAIRALDAMPPHELAQVRKGTKLLIIQDGVCGMRSISSSVVTRIHIPSSRFLIGELIRFPYTQLELGELQPPSCGPWGSTDVDEHFCSFLEEHLLGGRKIAFSDWLVIRKRWLDSMEYWDYRRPDQVRVEINQLVHAENFDGNALFSDSNLARINARLLTTPALASCNVTRVGRSRILFINIGCLTVHRFFDNSITETAKAAKRMLAQPNASDTELVVVTSCYGPSPWSRPVHSELYFDRMRTQLTVPRRSVVCVRACVHKERCISEHICLGLLESGAISLQSPCARHSDRELTAHCYQIFAPLMREEVSTPSVPSVSSSSFVPLMPSMPPFDPKQL
jgi:hypothetical protein